MLFFLLIFSSFRSGVYSRERACFIWDPQICSQIRLEYCNQRLVSDRPTEDLEKEIEFIAPDPFAKSLMEEIGLNWSFPNPANHRLMRKWIEMVVDAAIKRRENPKPIDPLIECPKIFQEYLWGVMEKDPPQDSNCITFPNAFSIFCRSITVETCSVKRVEKGIEIEGFTLRGAESPEGFQPEMNIYIPMFIENAIDNPCIEPLKGGPNTFERFIQAVAKAIYYRVQFEETAQSNIWNSRAKRGEGENNETND